ncbi:MAG: UDP-N-acetylenolpyruvoylglucosamine reductase, partial [candidate division WOR-3 bacterium]
KNPKDNLAGKLLDEVGLKGFKIGGAYVSNRHANFIINQGGAKFNDVLELIQIMKLRVEMKTNIILEEEIEIIPKKGGEFNGKK